MIAFTTTVIGLREQRWFASSRWNFKKTCRRVEGREHNRPVGSPCGTSRAARLDAADHDRRPTCDWYFLECGHAIEVTDPLPVGRGEQPAWLTDTTQWHGLKFAQGSQENLCAVLPAICDVRSIGR